MSRYFIFCFHHLIYLIIIFESWLFQYSKFLSLIDTLFLYFYKLFLIIVLIFFDYSNITQYFILFSYLTEVLIIYTRLYPLKGRVIITIVPIFRTTLFAVRTFVFLLFIFKWPLHDWLNLQAMITKYFHLGFPQR